VTRLLAIVQGCAAIALAVLLVLWIFAGWSLWPSLLAVGAVLVVTLLERARYKPIASKPPPGWQATGERFIDPETGKSVTVYYDPKSGERQYVNE
jgi:hypothetical protein